MSRFLCPDCYIPTTYKDNIYDVIMCGVVSAIIYSAIALFIIWIITARLYFKEKNPEEKSILVNISMTLSIVAAAVIFIYNIIGSINTFKGFQLFRDKLIKQGIAQDVAEQIARGVVEKESGSVDLSLASLVFSAKREIKK
jgi:hypothetical protein